MANRKNPYLALREFCDCTQVEMAEHIGITRGRWGQIENDTAPPSIELLTQIHDEWKHELRQLGHDLESLVRRRVG